MPTKAFEQTLSRVRELCLQLPETREVEAWGHPTFRAGKKMFAAFGQEGADLTIGLKVGHERQAVLLRDRRFYPTPYAARQGWVSLYLDHKTDWKELGELIRDAYKQVALKRMLKALEATDGA